VDDASSPRLKTFGIEAPVAPNISRAFAWRTFPAWDHLYGHAGLLMTMTTRNYLHTARRACLELLASDGHEVDGVKLVDTFFHARRYPRADLELVDERSPQRLDKLINQLGAEDEQSKPLEAADRKWAG